MTTVERFERRLVRQPNGCLEWTGARNADGGSRQKAKTHCPQRHEYTVENTYVYNGKRSCRACHRAQVFAANHRDRSPK